MSERLAVDLNNHILHGTPLKLATEIILKMIKIRNEVLRQSTLYLLHSVIYQS